MNPAKAIERLHSIVDAGDYRGNPDDSVAIRLGTEALELVQSLRRGIRPGLYRLLPSETED